MKISTTALALLFGCVTFKPTAAEDDGSQRRLLRGNPVTKGHAQPADRALNIFGDNAESAVGKASTDMLMGTPLKWFLSDNVPLEDQKSTILRMASESIDQGGRIVIRDEAEEDMHSYLVSQVEAGRMGEDTAEFVASGLGINKLYATASASNDVGPVTAAYDTSDFDNEGNMERLFRSNTLKAYNRETPKKHYTGIWGYSTGDREYAIQCHGYGIAIIDVTESPARRVQLILMQGGDALRDVVTWYNPTDEKTYAYVGAQDRAFSMESNSPPFQTDDKSGLWVIDLSYLSGDQPHKTDGRPRPIPPHGIKQIDGYNGITHTINAQRGLLFLNPWRDMQGVGVGCQVLDLTTNPMEPKFLFNIGGDCHDSFVRENIRGKDILIVSDGRNNGEKIYDITDVDANTDSAPEQLGDTTEGASIFDHSSWLSEDNRYLYVCDEHNVGGKGIVVYDVRDFEDPIEITRFQTSLQADYEDVYGTNTVPHNGMIRGGYLYVAYYGAGLRVFDISNPKLPVEVGKVETDRNPDHKGSPQSPFCGGLCRGAWNLYLGLPSGKILVNDMYNGLFVVKANRPYSNPLSPTLTAQRRIGDWVELKWNAVANARGYSVERKKRRGSRWKKVAEHLVFDGIFEPSFDVTLSRSTGMFYRIKAYNAEGIAYSQQIKVKPA